MITGFSVGNFKAFGSTQSFPLKPITLVFGPNSSGKSSLIHALALSHEIFKTGSIDVDSIEADGGVIRLGGFNKYVHRRQLNTVTELSCVFTSEYSAARYRVTLELGRSSDEPLEFTVLRYVATSDEGKIFELVHMKDDVGSILGVKDINIEHPEIIECLQRTFDAELLAIDDTKPLVTGTVEYAASRVAYRTTAFLKHRKNHGQLDLIYNIPIHLYLLLAHTASRDCQSWLSKLTSMAVAWEQDRPTREENTQEKSAEVCESANDDELTNAINRIAESQRSLERMAGPFNEFHSAISYVIENHRDKMDLYQPFFGMDEAEAEAFYAAIDTNELEALRNKADQLFNTLVDNLRTLIITVNKRLNGIREPPQLSITEDNIFYALAQLEVDKITRSDVPLNEPGFATFTYLGPIRALPSRTLQFGKEGHLIQAEGLWNLLQTDRMAQVNSWLGARYLNTNYLISSRPLLTFTPDELVQFIKQLSEEPKGIKAGSLVPSAYELVLTDLLTDTEVDFEAVGYGIGQVLPVLLACYETSGKLIAIEQPEIHLHPALQAELGDAFIHSINQQNNAFVLETHSEHLILRLMRRVRETSDGTLPEDVSPITPDDIAILYVEPTKTGSVVKEIRLDEEGQLIDAWPGGFFEEGFRERFA